MPDITISFGAEKIGEVRDALAAYGGAYNATIRNPVPGAEPAMIPNPQTRAEFAASVLRKVAVDIWRDHKRQAARQAADADADPA